MTLYEKILYELITKNVLEWHAVKALCAVGSNPHRQIKRLLDAGYIREKSYLTRSGRHKKLVKYYYLTPAGYRHAREVLCDSVPWCKCLKAVFDVRVIGRSYKTSLVAERYVKVTTSAVMAELAGAAENTVFISNYLEDKLDVETDSRIESEDTVTGGPVDVRYDSDSFDTDIPEDVLEYYAGLHLDLRDAHLNMNAENSIVLPKSLTLAELVSGARASYYHCGKHYSSDIRFVDALRIKGRIIEIATNKNITAPDLRGGRYTGMIGSSSRVAMVYYATRLSPVKWKRMFKKRETLAYSSGRQLFFKEHAHNSRADAVLLVTDEHALSASYDPPPVSRGAGKNERPGDVLKYGEGFNRFWVIPVSQRGAIELQTIMTTNCDDHKCVCEMLIDDGAHTYNTGPLAGSFPLIDLVDGVYTAVVLHLDILWLEHLNATIQRFSQYDYEILCPAWQIPYVKVIVREKCTITAIKDDMVPGRAAESMLAIETEAEMVSMENANDI